MKSSDDCGVASDERKPVDCAHHPSLTLRYGAVAAATVVMALSGCGSLPRQEPPSKPPPTVQRSGGYYLDDGPGDKPPADIDRIPDAVPRLEPLHRGAMRPYTVMGRSYTPMTSLEPYRARGIATWYGRRYHGKPTSSGEPYDMYAMTAAHTTLPIPSYVRVTNVANGRSVVVRVNDRGPFIDGRLIDLSYTAAHRIGVLGGGSAMVEVEALIPGRAESPVAAAPARPALPEPAVAASPEGKPLGKPPAVQAQELPPPVAAMQQPPVVSERGGAFVQLGAFSSRENAEAFLSRMRTSLEGTAERVALVPGDNLFRIHAGPYATAIEARTAAERIGQFLGIKPVVIVR